MIESPTTEFGAMAFLNVTRPALKKMVKENGLPCRVLPNKDAIFYLSEIKLWADQFGHATGAVEEALLAAENKRQLELRALCKLAGFNEETVILFVESGMSPAEAREFIRDSRQLDKMRTIVGIDASSWGVPQPKDERAKAEASFGKEFDSGVAKFGPESLGVSRQAYIASRLRTEGFEPVMPAKDQEAV